MRRVLLSSIAFLAALPAAAAPMAMGSAAGSTAGSATGNVSVSLDEVRTVEFPGPVATVYVGNPAIADINMIDARHAFVLGKSFGTTNIVALGHDGTQIANEHVTVFGHSASVVTLNLGASRVTYNCAADRCEPSPMPGDSKDAFDQALDQIGKHEDLGKKAAIGQ